MKKIFLLLSLFGLGLAGAGIAGAQYYNSNYYSTTYVPSASYQYSYGAAVGSYTIGCTTYYYNTTTGASLGSQNICTYQTAPVYTPPYAPPVVYANPGYSTSYDYYSYTYPSTNTQYCTWGYHNGTWRPCSSGGNMYYGGNYNNNYNTGYQNYLNCYYDQYGQYICW